MLLNITLLNISNLYADADDRSITPSRNTRSYTHRSIPSSPGRSFFCGYSLVMHNQKRVCPLWGGVRKKAFLYSFNQIEILFGILLGCPSDWKKQENRCFFFGGLGQGSSALTQRSSLDPSDPSSLPRSLDTPDPSFPRSWAEAEQVCQAEEAHLTSLRTEVNENLITCMF